MEQYEQKYKIKFDVVIKCRTDVIYFNKQCYKSEKLYLRKKGNIYNNIQTKTPEIRCWGLKKLDFVVGDDAREFFINQKNIQLNLFEQLELNWKTTPFEKYENGKIYYKDGTAEDFKYNTCNRITMNDWMLIANRKAAPYFYKYYMQYCSPQNQIHFHKFGGPRRSDISSILRHIHFHFQIVNHLLHFPIEASYSFHL